MITNKKKANTLVVVFFQHVRTNVNNGDHLEFLHQVLGMVHNPEVDDHRLRIIQKRCQLELIGYAPAREAATGGGGGGGGVARLVALGITALRSNIISSSVRKTGPVNKYVSGNHSSRVWGRKKRDGPSKEAGLGSCPTNHEITAGKVDTLSSSRSFLTCCNSVSLSFPSSRAAEPLPRVTFPPLSVPEFILRPLSNQATLQISVSSSHHQSIIHSNSIETKLFHT